MFGKYRNNSVIYWLELALTKDVYAKKPIPIGAEMFEADSQKFYNQYLEGAITHKKLDAIVQL